MTNEIHLVVKYRVPLKIIFEAKTNEEMVSKYYKIKVGEIELYDGSIKKILNKLLKKEL